MTHFLAPILSSRAACARPALVNARTGAVVASVVELAGDSGSRRRGLLGRDGIPAGHALVLAPCSAIHTWFMRFPIDVVFVSRDGRVLKVVAQLRPWRLAASMRAFAVIEMPVVTRRARTLAVGDRLVLTADGSEPHF